MHLLTELPISGMAVCLKRKSAYLLVSPVRIIVAILLLVIFTVKVTILFHRRVPHRAHLSTNQGLILDHAQSQANSQRILKLLWEELFERSNTSNCDNFRRCAAERKRALVNGCSQLNSDRFSSQFSGSHSIKYYYIYNIESCSGNEENLLDSLTFEVPTLQIKNTESANTRILHMDNPLLRIYQYYQTLKSGIGYLYLGEEIVYNYRNFNLSEIWKLPYIYEARLGLLWGNDDSENPYENPFGPTFLEFMIYLVDMNTIKPKNIAPTVQTCYACDTEYDIIVRNQNELTCFESLTADDSTDYLSYEAKTEIYHSFYNLPTWVQAHLYEMYSTDLNTFLC